jgi:hypothetical protein
MSAGAAAKAFNLGVIIISFVRGVRGHDEMGQGRVTWDEEYFMALPRAAAVKACAEASR